MNKDDATVAIDCILNFGSIALGDTLLVFSASIQGIYSRTRLKNYAQDGKGAWSGQGGPFRHTGYGCGSGNGKGDDMINGIVGAFGAGYSQGHGSGCGFGHNDTGYIGRGVGDGSGISAPLYERPIVPKSRTEQNEP